MVFVSYVKHYDFSSKLFRSVYLYKYSLENWKWKTNQISCLHNTDVGKIVCDDIFDDIYIMLFNKDIAAREIGK